MVLISKLIILFITRYEIIGDKLLTCYMYQMLIIRILTIARSIQDTQACILGIILMCISIATFSTSSQDIFALRDSRDSMFIQYWTAFHNVFERLPISSGLWTTRSYREWQRPRANRCSLSARIYATTDKPEIIRKSSARPCFRQTHSLLSTRSRKG